MIFLRTLATLLILASLLACASAPTETIDDPSFAYHEARVATSPSPTAIVGLWHRRKEDSTTIEYATWLFRADGTAVRKLKNDIIDNAGVGISDHDGIAIEGGWRYLGEGWWNNGMEKMRLAGDHLLLYAQSKKFPTIRTVYKRVR